MPRRNTEAFLRLMNEQNARIAAAAEAEASSSAGGGLDPARLASDAKRREKYGTLRAREKTRSKTQKVRSVFGHVDLS